MELLIGIVIGFVIGFVIGSFFPQPTFIRNLFASIKSKITGK